MADWTRLIGLIATGGVESIDASLGQVLQIRPKAPNSSVRVQVRDNGYHQVDTVPLGFYLRARFTESILWAGI